MEKSGLFEPKVINDYENTIENQWTMVIEIFYKQYERGMCCIKREGENKDYESMAALRRI